jgi:glycosyltransferase involved in cell wall biosynthesis
MKKGIHEQVLLLGKQNRVHEKLAVSDVMLLPSELESFGLAALEAMACEVVPVATNTGGIPEVIDHGVTGFTAGVGDIETMARYAIEVLSDDSKLQEIGKRARQEAHKRFCSTKIIPHYVDFYRGVLERAS